MAEHDDLPYIVIERHSGGSSAFLWGALLGAGVALLLAPRTGEETQEEIRQRARRLRMAAEGRVNDARDRVTETVSRTRSEIQDRIETVRDDIETRARHARQAVDVGRQATREARTELQRRLSEVKDSYAAVAEVVRNPPPRTPPAPPEADVIITEVIVETEPPGPDLI